LFSIKFCETTALGFVDNEDYWVYGTDSGTPGQFHWCSNGREFEPREIAWDVGEPNSKFHCVYMKNKGVNKTVLATADCDTEKNVLCDVRKRGTGGLAMQQECMEIWGITTSKQNLFKIRVNLNFFEQDVYQNYYKLLGSSCILFCTS
jgi:hypothetical protein